MSEGKQPTQADGAGTKPGGELTGGHDSSGESGGGAYPNPHTGKAPKEGFFGHGGQTDIDQKPTPGEPD